jgi:protein TonB
MYLSPLRSIVARDLTWPAMVADGVSPRALLGRPAISPRLVVWAIGVSLALHLAAAMFVLTRRDAPAATPAPTEIAVDLVSPPPLPPAPQIATPSPPADLAPAAPAPAPETTASPPAAVVPAAPPPAVPVVPKIAAPAARPAPPSPAPAPRPRAAAQQPAAPVAAPPAAAASPAAPAQTIARPVVTVPPRPVAGLSKAEPVYPALALRRHEEGRVMLRVQVSPEGMPVAVLVLAGSGNASLDEAAAVAVRLWRFTPATSNGVPVAATADVPIEFRIAR